jgi:hypothetical protein
MSVKPIPSPPPAHHHHEPGPLEPTNLHGDKRPFYIEQPGGVMASSTARHELNGHGNVQTSGCDIM